MGVPVDLLRKEVPCNTQPCLPTNCVLGPWTDSTSCSKLCNSGTKIQTRTTMTPAINGGTCGPTSEEVPCNTQPCLPTNCVFSFPIGLILRVVLNYAILVLKFKLVLP